VAGTSRDTSLFNTKAEHTQPKTGGLVWHPVPTSLGGQTERLPPALEGLEGLFKRFRGLAGGLSCGLVMASNIDKHKMRTMMMSSFAFLQAFHGEGDLLGLASQPREMRTMMVMSSFTFLQAFRGEDDLLGFASQLETSRKLFQEHLSNWAPSRMPSSC
jgi:hypothetical protein